MTLMFTAVLRSHDIVSLRKDNKALTLEEAELNTEIHHCVSLCFTQMGSPELHHSAAIKSMAVD